VSYDTIRHHNDGLYSVCQKIAPRFSGTISHSTVSTTENFKMTFYTPNACSFLRKIAWFYSIISNFDKAVLSTTTTEYWITRFARQTRKSAISLQQYDSMTDLHIILRDDAERVWFWSCPPRAENITTVPCEKQVSLIWSKLLRCSFEKSRRIFNSHTTSLISEK